MSLPEEWERSAAHHRGLVTAITLVVCLAILLLMAIFGMKGLTAPFGNKESSTSTCPPEDLVRTTHVARDEVQVSVYNAGGAKGVAGRTLARLERAGFRPGEVGNAPEGQTVDGDVIYTTEEDDVEAQLLSLYLGKIPVEVVEEEYGPGLDLFVGPGNRKFTPKAPKKIALPEPIERCDRS